MHVQMITSPAKKGLFANGSWFSRLLADVQDELMIAGRYRYVKGGRMLFRQGDSPSGLHGLGTQELCARARYRSPCAKVSAGESDLRRVSRLLYAVRSMRPVGYAPPVQPDPPAGTSLRGMLGEYFLSPGRNGYRILSCPNCGLTAMVRSLTFAGAAAVAMLAAPATAATPDTWAKLDKGSEAACLKAANLGDATAGPPVRYSDRTGMDARVVTGTWPQPHMNGAKGKMLCLYNRKTKRVEVQELAEPVVKAAAVVKDVWWRAEDIGGKGISDNSEVTLMLGGDGKIGGKSGCNGYSANYQLAGDALKVFPPMIGTRMMCSPALINQEQAYRTLIESAQSVSITPEGALIITSAGGATSHFMRK